MANKVRPLGLNGMTPRVLLETLVHEIDEVEDIFIVAFDKQKNPVVYAAGDLTTIGLAILMLQTLGLQAMTESSS